MVRLSPKTAPDRNVGVNLGVAFGALSDIKSPRALILELSENGLAAVS